MPLGRVTLVGAGPGAPDLITLRGRQAILAAEIVLYDALLDEAILEGTTARRVYVGKRCGSHSLSQEAIIQLLIDHALAGRQVVRLKGGDPGVLGRVGEEIVALAAAGVPFELVPGVSSALAAPALAGIPLTHRGVADAFTVASAHPRGENPEFSIPPFHESNTVVLLMGVTTLDEWSRDLAAKGYPGDLPAALVMDVSLPSQNVVVTRLDRLALDGRPGEVRSPAVAIVGRVVDLRTRSPAPVRPAVHPRHDDLPVRPNA